MQRVHEEVPDFHRDLTPQQIIVLDAMMRGASMPVAAASVGVHVTTVYSWMTKAPFIRALDLRRAILLHAQMIGLDELVGVAFKTIRSAMDEYPEKGKSASESGLQTKKMALAAAKIAVDSYIKVQGIAVSAQITEVEKKLDRIIDWRENIERTPAQVQRLLDDIRHQEEMACQTS